MTSFLDGMDADVDKEEMQKSESKSKYAHVQCERHTTPLHLARETCVIRSSAATQSYY